MTTEEDDPDLMPFTTALVEVLIEPYVRLINRLQVEGRLTEAEIQALTAEVVERRPRLAELVADRLHDDGEESLSDHRG